MTTIRKGSKGEAVVQWQTVLGVTVDGSFGPITERATKAWQKERGLTADGIVGPKTWAASESVEPDTSVAKWIRSPNFTKGRKRAPLVIVLHTTESPEVANGAERVARNWFARPESKVSAHYIVSSTEVVQCVHESDTAWHSGKANGWTIGVEMCGKAGQSASDWVDPFSRQMLDRTARLVADICKRHSIPVTKLGPGDLKLIAEGNDLRGITGHVDVSKGLGGSHWDPGPAFPWQAFLEAVQGYMANPPTERL